MMMTVALRFIPTLLEETDKIMKAQASRGPTLKRETYLNGQRVSYLYWFVVCKRIQKADDLAMAMEARCYRGGEGRTRMKQMKLSKVDLKITLSFLIFESVLVYVQYFKCMYNIYVIYVEQKSII